MLVQQERSITMKEFKDKVIVVTGGARGIGKAIAVEGAKRGMNVVLNDIDPLVCETAKEIEAMGVKCVAQNADISIYETNRNLLYNGLRELGFDVVKPDGTFYIFPKTLEKDDIAFCERAKQYDILIVPGTGFGCPGHTRISYCVPTERIERSLEAFKKLADSYK